MDRSGASRRTLVVEDCRDTADTLRILLDLWGHDVRTADDALLAFDRHAEERSVHTFSQALRAYADARARGYTAPELDWRVALSHIALYKIGAVAIPLFTLFGPEALEYRLKNSGARAVITDAANMEKILEIKDRLPELNTLIVTRGDHQEGIVDFWQALGQRSQGFMTWTVILPGLEILYRCL